MVGEKKITKATFKSFARKNKDNLWIKCKSDFDGMVDCVTQAKDPMFKPCENDKDYVEHTLGLNEVWLVGSSRDYFTPYEDNFYKGIEVSNSCGSFILAIVK